MRELKKKVEAILFSVARYINIEEIGKLCHEDAGKVKEVLLELKVDLEKDSSLVILNEGEKWKLTTREEYSKIVRKVVTQTELSKTLMETLAIIAFKYPIKQSDLIKIRTNKAYDHLSELEEQGFISRQKYGRSRLIKLTDKFFDYFDLPRDKLKERFKGFEQLASSIESKENENEKLKIEQASIIAEVKKQEEENRKVQNGQIEIIDEEDDETKKEVEPYYGKDEKEIDETDDTKEIEEAIDRVEDNKQKEEEDDGGNNRENVEEEDKEEEKHESMKDAINEVLGK